MVCGPSIPNEEYSKPKHVLPHLAWPLFFHIWAVFKVSFGVTVWIIQNIPHFNIGIPDIFWPSFFFSLV